MKTQLVVLGLLLSLLGHAGVKEVEINGLNRLRVTKPDGSVSFDQMETLKEGALSGEHWYWSTEDPTQRVCKFKSVRSGAGFKDTENIYTTWYSDGSVSNVSGILESRGFMGGRNSGAVTWKSWDGTRTLAVSTVEFLVSWEGASSMCVTNDADGNPVDRGCSCVSVFRYTGLPNMMTGDMTNLAGCTLTQYRPGYSDNSVRRVAIPVPMGAYCRWMQREECYFCNDDAPCWHGHWGSSWSQPCASASKVGKTALIYMPAPSGLMASILRSEDLEKWIHVGTVEAKDGVMTFLDTNAPDKNAFYRWEGQ